MKTGLHFQKWEGSQDSVFFLMGLKFNSNS